MSDQPKPPLSVWRTAVNREQNFYSATDVQWPLAEVSVGPYVHLDQFMELVEARALSLARKHANATGQSPPYPSADLIEIWHAQACKEIKQEIEEGKI